MPRLFFALWPNPDGRARLIEPRDLAAHDYRGRPVRTDLLHITLVYLGETPELRVPLAMGCADRIQAQRKKSFTLNVDTRAHFRAARVAWLGCTDPPGALNDLWDALRQELEGAQFPIRERDFHPHITVARDCVVFPAPSGIPAIEWPVQDFVLVDSARTSGGTVYRVLRQWPLEG